MNIKFLNNPGLYVLIILLGFWIMFFSIWDIIFDKGWIIIITACYVVLIVFLAILTYIKYKYKDELVEDTISEFEKTLMGELYHFKCPNCDGFFAIKKSKSNHIKPVKMTCPDCGMIGFIPA